MPKKGTFSRFKKVVGAPASNGPGSYAYGLFFPSTPITAG